MRSIVIKQYGGPENLAIKDMPDPVPQTGQVAINIKAFGLNRAELYFRAGLWGDVAEVTGIECVGEIHHDPANVFTKGQKVIALMGGMGRTINGSYAEMVVVPTTSVVAINSALSWAELAAIPESYATAWACLNKNLTLQKGQTILIRGATSALGQAAVNVAVSQGVKVIATTRNRDRFDDLEQLGAEPLLHDDLSASLITERYHGGVDAVLDIIGNSTLVDSLACVKHGGRVCLVGFLGGGDPLVDFNPLMQMPSGVQLSFFGSAFVLGTKDFPLSDIPFQTLIDQVEAGIFKAKPDQVFGFDDIVKAHELMEANKANGKLVVKV